MPNIMKEVASALGVGLGQRFKIKGKHTPKNDFVLREDRLKLVTEYGKECHTDDWLELMLTGRAEIIKKPWVPEEGDTYYLWDTYTDIRTSADKWNVYSESWDWSPIDINWLVMGNCFPTKEEALANKDKVLKLYNDIKEEMNDEV